MPGARGIEEMDGAAVNRKEVVAEGECEVD